MEALNNSWAGSRIGFRPILVLTALLAVVNCFNAFNRVSAGVPEGEAFAPLPSAISPTFFVDRSMAGRSLESGEAAAAALTEAQLVQRIADVVSGIGSVPRGAGQPGNAISNSIVVAYDGTATTEESQDNTTRQAAPADGSDPSAPSSLKITFARTQPSRSPLEAVEEVDMFTVELEDLSYVVESVSVQPEVQTMVVNFKPLSDREDIARTLEKILEAPHIVVMQYDMTGEPRGVQTSADDAPLSGNSLPGSFLRGVQSGSTAQIAALRQVLGAVDDVLPLAVRQVLQSLLEPLAPSSAGGSVDGDASATGAANPDVLLQRINKLLGDDAPLVNAEDSSSTNIDASGPAGEQGETGGPRQEPNQSDRGAANIDVGDLLQAIGFSAPPDDTMFGQLWGMNNQQHTHASIQALGAWKLHTGREVADEERVKICVIDSGVDGLHEDLKGNMWTNPNETENNRDDDGNGCIDDIHGCRFSGTNAFGYNSDTHGHGTHCAGTVAAVGNNQLGVTGVLWNANIVGVSFDWSLANSVRALDYSTRIGCKVVSASWGFVRPTPALREAIARARRQGVLFVSAVDNRGVDMCDPPSGYGDYPPMYSTTLDNIITVANIKSDGNLAASSNYCAKYTRVAAPGSGILSTIPGGYAKYTGTSMATPHVAGTLGLIASAYPNQPWDYKKARSIILDSVTKRSTLKGKVSSGGILNAEEALKRAIKVFGEPPARVE